MGDETLGPFKRWFWRPPRSHGEVIADRTVSFLELFYDLVYVAVIGQAAHHLAEHVSMRGFAEFVIVFSLIWIAWVNGSLYIEIHGRQDGRTRIIVFTQMGVLVLLAVFTADAADDNSPGFAIVYAVFLGIVTWLFDAVRRQERHDRPEFVAETGRYVVGMACAMAVILASALLPTGPRLVVWAAVVVGWIVGIVLAGHATVGLHRGMPPTESLVERFGLFTIIVLGEVVFGVVDGLSSVEHDAQTITTGMIALGIGLGLWWVYFDLVGRRLPRNDGPAVAHWLLSHLPFTLSIAAAGAAMVSLVEHAHAARTPASTAWLLAGTLALSLLAVSALERSLADAQRLSVVYQPMTLAMLAGSLVTLGVGWARPAPWLFALLLVLMLSVLWCFAVSRFLRVDAWGEDQARAD
ncbi:MAG TPA: low temperature requirement protein A [Propionibacteriaceae bacterium]|nr:low temperature requirement protein A [Propionibacteriaceae bacterium]